MNTGLKNFILVISVIAGIAAAAAVSCMAEVIKVSGDSMEPSVRDGSHVIVSRMAYFWGEPDPDDVVAFPCDVYSEDEEGGILIRRVVGTEGDKIKIEDGTLYVNGKVYDKYADAGVYLEDMDRITVGKGKVFVLSDTGRAVLDSRDQAVGQLRADELTGRVLFK